MSEIRHIVFDIGKVLIHYDPELLFIRLIPEADKRRWFFAHVCTPEWNVEQDRGRDWGEAEALLIAEHPEFEDHIRAFRRHWHEMVPHAYEDVVEIMEGLIERGHDVTMLTNFAADTFAEAQERFDFLNKPRGVTVSGAVKLLKPQREIYDHHVETFGLHPPATLFIDDSEKNVEGAKDAGWQAVHFRDAATLASDLARLGVAV
ncbi:MAG: HAD family phosphatase [Pseudomonadota bacterium]|nr:HAD family phosphatase [Pseudomonadota bacterium]